MRSSIAIVFSIPHWMPIDFDKLKPFFHHKGVIKVYLNDSCLIDWTKEVREWDYIIMVGLRYACSLTMWKYGLNNETIHVTGDYYFNVHTRMITRQPCIKWCAPNREIYIIITQDTCIGSLSSWTRGQLLAVPSCRNEFHMFLYACTSGVRYDSDWPNCPTHYYAVLFP